jgi:hypothetical protein
LGVIDAQVEHRHPGAFSHFNARAWCAARYDGRSSVRRQWRVRCDAVGGNGVYRADEIAAAAGIDQSIRPAMMRPRGL